MRIDIVDAYFYVWSMVIAPSLEEGSKHNTASGKHGGRRVHSWALHSSKFRITFSHQKFRITYPTRRRARTNVPRGVVASICMPKFKDRWRQHICNVWKAVHHVRSVRLSRSVHTCSHLSASVYGCRKDKSSGRTPPNSRNTKNEEEREWTRAPEVGTSRRSIEEAVFCQFDCRSGLGSVPRPDSARRSAVRKSQENARKNGGERIGKYVGDYNVQEAQEI
ncbi:hypothetical protein C8R44DRAFT_724237 [Mycena epipterygia]|nr:hypothetical protein C8R44DRAFT_724237 [Mycena epipterygia]